MAQSVFHSPSGGFDFLGLRKGRRGGVEIVYDDGVARRMVWRVQGRASESQIGEALARDKLVRLALDQAMADESAALHDGAEVAFFPPVTGG